MGGWIPPRVRTAIPPRPASPPSPARLRLQPASRLRTPYRKKAPASLAARAPAGPAASRAPAGGPVGAAVPEETPRLARGEGRSPRDMFMSLAVLLVPIALLLILYRTLLSGDAPITVDPNPTIQEAQQAG